jgi:hypothetical protein
MRKAVLFVLAACGGGGAAPTIDAPTVDIDAAPEIDAPPADLYALSGMCGVLNDPELTGAAPVLVHDAMTFARRYNDPADRALLTDGGRTIVETPNAGGSSIYSEVFAFEQLAKCEMAGLLKTETQIVYDTAGKITDILVTIDGKKVGVSVVRAVQFPFGTPYTLDNATMILTKKLEDIQESSMNVSPGDKWVKQVLAVLAYDEQHADTVEQAWLGLSATVKADTVVVVTATHGDDAVIYTNQ